MYLRCIRHNKQKRLSICQCSALVHILLVRHATDIPVHEQDHSGKIPDNHISHIDRSNHDLDEEIKSYPTIFMFNNAVQWLPYFIIGNLFGLKLSRLILDYPSKYIIVLTTLVTFIGLQAIDCNLPAYFFLKAIVLFLCFMSALSYFNDNKNHICAIVRTLGTSTLFILCIHILIQTPFQRAIMKIFGHREVFTGYIDVALTLLVIYLLIPFVNKYLPWAIGKKR